MTEKQLFYPLLSVYFSLILGDLQKEKLQIVSIFRFGHKKRGLFQCPPLGKVGMGPQLALLPLGRLRWGFLYIMYFSISLWENRYSQQDIYLY